MQEMGDEKKDAKRAEGRFKAYLCLIHNHWLSACILILLNSHRCAALMPIWVIAMRNSFSDVIESTRMSMPTFY